MAKYINADELQAKINGISDYLDALSQLELVCDAITEAPTADVREVMNSAWIPVSERLPEVYTMYLVTLDDGTVYFLYWEWGDHFKHWVDEEGNSDYIVTAWMPLPESFKPYRGDE